MKIISFILCILMVFSMGICSYAQSPSDSAPQVTAKSVVLMEMSTGKVLYGKNENEKLPPASITKIMTLLLTMEAIDEGKISLHDKVTASKNAASKGGSQIWLKEGEEMTVHELIKAAAVASANDASTALGEFVAGDEDTFIAAMNKRAKELGMKNTNFENCTGLDDSTENHYSTALDIAVMSCELMKHKKIEEYTKIWMDTLRNGKTELVNTNRLIRFYEGITGLKTGTTSKAGYCVSATARKDNMELVAVVLGCNDSKQRFADAQKLLNWGFSNFSMYKPTVDMSQVTPVRVLYGKENTVTPEPDNVIPVLIKKGTEGTIKQRTEICLDVNAPVEKNQILGKVFFESDGKVLTECSLKCPSFAERRSTMYIFSLLWSTFAKK